MIRFCRKANEPIVLLFVKVVQKFGSQEVTQTTLFSPAGTSEAPNITKLVFPKSSYEPSNANDTYMFYLKSNDTLPSYGYVHYSDDFRERCAYVLISSYYDPKFFFGMISEAIERAKNGSYSQVYSYIQNNFKSKPKRDYFNRENKRIRDNLAELFSAFDIEMVGMLFVYLMLDTKIIITGKNIGKVTNLAFALLSAIHPLMWPGVFIPMLSESLIDTVYAPFPYIIGIHSDLLPFTNTSDMENHVVVNYDDHTISCVPTKIQVPLKINSIIKKFKKSIVESSFDKVKIQIYIHKLLVKATKVGVGCRESNPQKMHKNWEKLKSSTKTDGYHFLISQSQVVLNLMRAIEVGPGDEVYDGFFNNNHTPGVAIQPVPFSAPTSNPSPLQRLDSDSDFSPFSSNNFTTTPLADATPSSLDFSPSSSVNFSPSSSFEFSLIPPPDLPPSFPTSSKGISSYSNPPQDFTSAFSSNPPPPPSNPITQCYSAPPAPSLISSFHSTSEIPSASPLFDFDLIPPDDIPPETTVSTLSIKSVGSKDSSYNSMDEIARISSIFTQRRNDAKRDIDAQIRENKIAAQKSLSNIDNPETLGFQSKLSIFGGRRNQSSSPQSIPNSNLPARSNSENISFGRVDKARSTILSPNPGLFNK